MPHWSLFQALKLRMNKTRMVRRFSLETCLNFIQMYFETLMSVKINQNFSLNSGITNYLFLISKAVGTKILLSE